MRHRGGQGYGRRVIAGFTLVEVLVATAMFAVILAGSHGLLSAVLTSWTKGNQSRALYQNGLMLADSIARDAVSAKNMTGSTTNAVAPNSDVLVLNYAARRQPSGQYLQKRITYQIDNGNFVRVTQTALTGSKNPLSWWSSVTGTTWVLSKTVSRFDLMNTNLVGYPRPQDFYLFLHRDGPAGWVPPGPGYQYSLRGYVYLRRAADVGDDVVY